MEQPAALTLTDPPTSALGASPAFVVELEAFSGPLDLLLHLLREEQIEIADIPIARIADQFLLVIHDLGLNQAADYLEMAGRLLRLKAQMLLPRRSEEEGWEDPRAELVRRLLEYQQIRRSRSGWARRPSARADQFARGLPAGAAGPPAAAARSSTWSTCWRRCERVIERDSRAVLHRVVARPLDVEGATRRLDALLRRDGGVRLARGAGARARPSSTSCPRCWRCWSSRAAAPLRADPGRPRSRRW